MSNSDRYLKKQILADLKKKMVFMGGPRQVGKTTLSLSLKPKARQGYLNWDASEHREKILRQELPKTDLWIFDEIHKYKNWRNYLKGLYDLNKGKKKILVTGSARLDYYRRGGDSLQGRYHYLRLHPLSVAELKLSKSADMLDLLKLGGFPEPYFGQSAVDAKRWSREYRERLIYDDLKNLEDVSDLGSIELLMLRLPDLVGAPLSVNAIREDLQVSHKALSNWLTILERLYAIYRLPPFGQPSIKAIKKGAKHYHYDWTLIKNESLAFENMMACHLLKWVHYQIDCYGENYELRYFRDVDGREVDFVVLLDNKPTMAIECKWSDDAINPALIYLKRKYPEIRAMQLHAVGQKDYVSPEGITVTPALNELKKWI